MAFEWIVCLTTCLLVDNTPNIQYGWTIQCLLTSNRLSSPHFVTWRTGTNLCQEITTKPTVKAKHSLVCTTFLQLKMKVVVIFHYIGQLREKEMEKGAIHNNSSTIFLNAKRPTKTFIFENTVKCST